MPNSHLAIRGAKAAILSLPALACVVLAWPSSVSAQPIVAAPQTPLPAVTTETTTGPDGVETVTRTRRIPAQPLPSPQNPAVNYPAQPYPGGYYPTGPIAPAAAVFERDQWLAECRRRTADLSEDDKSSVIGALLGAVAGGFIGNRVADGERLGGTLIGAGTGGLAGLALGNLVGGGKKDGQYDCEAAIDGYLSQYGEPGPRVAARTIPRAPAYSGYPYPGYTYQAYPPAYYGYGYTQPPQNVLVPIRYEQRQRVIVRETVREERIPGSATGASRVIPSPKMIKGQ